MKTIHVKSRLAGDKFNSMLIKNHLITEITMIHTALVMAAVVQLKMKS